MADAHDLSSATEPTGPQPLLYSRREYVEHMDGGTTTCVSTTTSPVKEFTPDD